VSLIRPELLAAAERGREVIAALGLTMFGGWLALLGGYFFLPLGGLLVALGVGWGILSIRRLRFRQAGEAPGIVRVTEAQIAYMGPRVGGFVGLPELAEIRLLTLRGRRIWRLRQADGAMLHIPVEADGAEALFDAFATLPGLDTAALVAALGSEVPSDSKVIALNGVDRLLWSRKGAGMVVR
jgi:hypothetical protein